jgi:hypothetical protein
MLRVAALLLVQLNAAFCPGPIVAGLATSVTPRILIVAEAEAVTPPAPVAVAVKVVLAVGEIAAVPESATEVTSSPKTGGVIATDVAFVLVHVRFVVCPAATTFGEMLSDIVGAEPWGTTVTTTEEVAVLPFASVAVPT